MKTFKSFVAFAMCMGSLAGCATHKTPPPPTVVSGRTDSDKKITEHSLVTATATVVSVDHKRREVTLLGSDGKTETVKVGDEVRNFAQVRKGDQVVVKYYESVVVQVKKPGATKPGVTEAAVADRAAPGEKPAGAVANETTIVATVQKIDRKNQTVTLKGPEGNLVTIDVKEPRHLEGLKKGDRVQFTFVEALAISVEKP